MKITKIELENFKRFSKLEINNIPDTSKLVLLIGSNGSGKSSVFDAFGFIDGAIKKDVPTNEEFWNYFKKRKDGSVKVSIFLDDSSIIIMSDSNYGIILSHQNKFYGRTSFRQISRLTRTSLGQGADFIISEDSDRPKFFIDKDERFDNDLEKITETILKDVFHSGKSSNQIRHKYIDPINKGLKNIFGDGNGTKLQLIEIIPPLEGKVAQITFVKGESEIHYNYLSAGEKEIVNLLFNLLSRASLYQDTIYFFDEIDLHLNTKLQYNLLKEITENWIPENCQLWTASHSLGFIEYAKQSENATIIDFDDLNFDFPQLLTPSLKDNPDVYEIAVGKDFLPALFKQMNIYFVENKDRNYYASIGIPNTVFVSDNNRNNVYHKVRATEFKGIVDRDFLSDDDILQIRQYYPNLRILNYYCIENYMYHPDNLEEFYASKQEQFDKIRYIHDLTEAKNQIRELIVLQIMSTRFSYPYFGEPEFKDKPLQKRFKNDKENITQSGAVQEYLYSNDLEIFYKSLPMKTYCNQLLQRKNVSPTELVKTAWFKNSIESILL